MNGLDELISIIATVMRASRHSIVGRLGSDPEVRYLESGKCVSNGRIAVNVPGAKQGDGKQPDWFKVEVWGDQAQAFTDACRKGDLVEVVGRVKTSRWTDRNTGEQKLELVVTVEEWQLVQSRQAPAQAPAPQQQQPAHLAAAGWSGPAPQQQAPAPAAAPAPQQSAWQGDPPF